jgi:hypothetical protein
VQSVPSSQSSESEFRLPSSHDASLAYWQLSSHFPCAWACPPDEDEAVPLPLRPRARDPRPSAPSRPCPSSMRSSCSAALRAGVAEWLGLRHWRAWSDWVGAGGGWARWWEGNLYEDGDAAVPSEVIQTMRRATELCLGGMSEARARWGEWGSTPGRQQAGYNGTRRECTQGEKNEEGEFEENQ